MEDKNRCFEFHGVDGAICAADIAFDDPVRVKRVVARNS
jgi:hypothetical protein